MTPISPNGPARSIRRVLVVAAAVALVAAACGSDDDTTASAEVDTQAGTGAASEDDTTDAETAAADERRADWPTTIAFGAVPAENASSLEADFGTTQAILEAELGLDEVEFFQATDYAGVIEGIIAGRVDVAQFGGFSYVIATSNGADISVAGVQTEGPDVDPGYRSYALTQADNDEIASIEDFVGKTVCFVDPGSTSGFLFPSEGLLAANIDPSETSTDIAPTFAGGHDASALAIANGDCDAGFAYDTMVTDQLLDSGDLSGIVDTVEDENIDPDQAELKIVWKSEVISGAPMAISNELPADFVAAFIEVVTTKVNVDWAVANGYCEGDVTDNDCAIADQGDIWGFAARDDSFFDGIRQVCEITQASKCNEG